MKQGTWWQLLLLFLGLDTFINLTGECVVDGFAGWQGVRQIRPQSESIVKGSLLASRTTSPVSDATIQLKSYVHDGWSPLTYRFLPASGKNPACPPFLLIHPVGIGLSSWYWERFLIEVCSNKKNHPACYAPNLIGCGVQEGSTPWNPDERALQFPISWVEQCETLIRNEILTKSSQPSDAPTLWFGLSKSKPKVTVVCQGGLAPVGILLASRNPELVQNLILCSPPTWKDLTTPIPKAELAKNYNFLRSKLFGTLAFNILENKFPVKFFSNAFLFGKSGSDDVWLENTLKELCPAARPPVQAFNAGLLLAQSCLTELQKISSHPDQRILVLQGPEDTEARRAGRQPFVEQLGADTCQIVTLSSGRNVLPWENPSEALDAIASFLDNSKGKKSL